MKVSFNGETSDVVQRHRDYLQAVLRHRQTSPPPGDVKTIQDEDGEGNDEKREAAIRIQSVWRMYQGKRVALAKLYEQYEAQQKLQQAMFNKLLETGENIIRT